jgi:hypothetical protein
LWRAVFLPLLLPPPPPPHGALVEYSNRKMRPIQTKDRNR